MPRHGVLYRPGDYLGFWRRVGISIADAGVVVASAALLIAIEMGLGLAPGVANGLVVASAFAAVSIIYLVFLKRSAARTIGYRMFGARIVNLRGEQPTVWQMLQRLGFLVFGPGNYVIDLAWIGQEGTKQTLRDKWAATYVVREEAQPRAEGCIETALHDFLGFSILFEEVKEPRPDPHGGEPAAPPFAGGNA